jgi:hypothetical protein
MHDKLFASQSLEAEVFPARNISLLKKQEKCIGKSTM